MFRYFYRIMDRYEDKKIIACAILGDNDISWRPDKYNYSFYNTELIYRYNMYKILDADDEALGKIKNVFAPAIIAAKHSIFLKGEDKEKVYSFKINLIRSLYERGYKREEIINLFRFIDILIYTPKEMKDRLISDIREIEEVKEMPYLSPTEQAILEEGIEKGIEKGLQEGIERGLERGREEGLQEGLQIALKLKFGKQGIEFYEKYIKKEKALKRLKELLNKIEDAKDIKDLM